MSSAQPSSDREAAPPKTGGRNKYVPKACQECRKRRTKCDGNKPTCSRCAARSVSCVYTAQADGRGTAPKSYVRLLQTRINLLEKILWLHSIDIDEATTRLAQLDALPNDSDRSTLAAAGQSNVAFAELCDKFEGVLSIDESLNFDGDGEARYFGPASGRLEFDCPDSQTDSPSNSDRSAQPHSIETGIDCDLEAHLLELYFTWEGPWLHIVDEALFRESRETNGRFFSPLLLNCILACACRYSDRPEVRSNPDDPNTAGDRFREAAEALLPREVKVPNITTIQSLAVLSMSYHALGQDAAGWLHGGMADRLIFDMGLHLDPDSLVKSGRMTTEEAELRRRIYWACYSNDKLAAGYTGRGCTMFNFQGSVRMPAVPDHATPSDPRHKLYTVSPALEVSLLTGLVKLGRIYENIFLNLYTPKKLALSDKRGKFMDSCLLELKSWQYSLPSELKPTDENRHEHLPQAYLLLMVYHTAVILLAKPFVQEAGTEATGTPDAPKPTPLQQKAQQCYLEAARNIASLGDQYRRNVGSFRTSPISATYTSLSAVLALLDCQRNSNRPLNRPGNPDHGHIVACLTTLEQLSTAWMPPGKYHRNVLKLIRSKWTVEDAEGFDEGLQKSLDDTPLDTSISGALGDWNQLTDPGDPVFNNAPLPLWMPGLEGDMSAQHSAGDGTGLFQIPEEFLNTQLDPFLTWSDFTQAGDANNDRGN